MLGDVVLTRTLTRTGSLTRNLTYPLFPSEFSLLSKPNETLRFPFSILFASLEYSELTVLSAQTGSGARPVTESLVIPGIPRWES